MHEVLLEPALEKVLVQCARTTVVDAVRDEIERLRTCLRQGSIPNGEATAPAIASRVERTLLQKRRPKLVPVINATGILLHTNLGPDTVGGGSGTGGLPAARGYLNLELSLDDGKHRAGKTAFGNGSAS